MKTGRQGAWVLVFLLAGAGALVACDKDEASAADEPVSIFDGEVACEAAGVEAVEAWFAAALPSFEGDRWRAPLPRDVDGAVVEAVPGMLATIPSPAEEVIGEREAAMTVVVEAPGDDALGGQGAFLNRLRRQISLQEDEPGDPPKQFKLYLDGDLPMKYVITVLSQMQNAGATPRMPMRHEVSRLQVILEREEVQELPEGVEAVPANVREQTNSLVAEHGSAAAAYRESVGECEALDGALDSLLSADDPAAIGREVGEAWVACECNVELPQLADLALRASAGVAVGGLELRLSPEGEEVTYHMEQPWQEVVDRLVELGGQEVYLALRTEDGDEVAAADARWDDEAMPLVIDGTGVPFQQETQKVLGTEPVNTIEVLGAEMVGSDGGLDSLFEEAMDSQFEKGQTDSDIEDLLSH